ncbi:MAG: hypothetical protein ACKO63_11345 [Nodosilinea sp.]
MDAAMNRYLIGAVMAGLVLLGMVGAGRLGRLFADPGQTGQAAKSQASAALGSLPVEQAGRLAQRQSDPQGAPTAAVGANAPASSRSQPATTPVQPFTTQSQTPPSVTISPNQATPTVPSGDISPLQPDLVRPGGDQPSPNPDLDAIPALW